MENPKNKLKDPKTNKTRYKQSYRTAWESMKDFKGWLTSVPNNSSKAYCKLCEKELHCHRLSLLKHKVTQRHHQKELSCGMNEYLEIPNLYIEEPKNTNIIQLTQSEKRSTNTLTNSSISRSEDEQSDSNDVNDISENEDSESEIDTQHKLIIEKGSALKEPLSTHILDLTSGTPASGIQIVLYKLIDGRWTTVRDGKTNSDGRYSRFFNDASEMTASRYKLHFDVCDYFSKRNISTIFPFIEIIFDVKNLNEKYHIPLLLNPYGYTTYRGS